jgi:hypothetical protein
MTEIPIDFETAFSEVNTLNRLFADYTAYTIPRLNPAEFETTDEDATTVVIRGRRTGLYYGSSRTRRTEPNGNYTYRYTPFVRVRPEERKVIDWVRV